MGLRYFACAALPLVLAGCTMRVTDFTLLSTKNVDLSRMDEMRRDPRRVEGVDSSQIIVIVPTKLRPDMKEAIDRAIESVPGGVALVDGVVSMTSWYIPLIYGEQSWTVEGSVLVDPALAGR
jgi:hypothetical protein